MKLGIIGKVDESSFKKASELGLDFLEFCINVGNEPAKVFADISKIKQWMKIYNVSVQSIGRWGSDRLDTEGNYVPEEFENCKKLINVASEVGCPVFVCGCNYVQKLSYMDNLNRATEWFASIIEYARPRGVKVAVYNCRWNNYIVDERTWKIVLGQLPELGIKYDPSHCLVVGGNYLVEMRDWAERFYHFHVKGSLVIGGKLFDNPPAGMDQTDWGSIMAILYAKKYEGGLSIEPHSAVWTGELGDKGVEFTVAYMKRLLFR